MYRWTRKMPSWQNRSFFVQFKIFSQKSGEKYRIELSSGNFYETVFGRVDFSFHTPGDVLGQKLEVFHRKSENGSKVLFFSIKSSFFSNCFSGHMECSFGNSAKTVSPKNWKISLISQNSRTFGFSQNFFSETFNWSRRMPSWQPWSFPSSQNVLSKTMKRYKNVPSSREIFLSKCSLGHIELSFHTLGKKICENFGRSPFRVRKDFQSYVFVKKNSLFPQIASAVAWSAFAANLPVMFREQPFIFPSEPQS